MHVSLGQAFRKKEGSEGLEDVLVHKPKKYEPHAVDKYYTDPGQCSDYLTKLVY